MKGSPGTAPYVMFTINTIKLEIMPNGRFALQDMGVPKSGNVSVQGDKAILTVTQVAGKSMELQSVATKDSTGPIEITGQPDQTLIYSDPKAMDPSPVRLKRIATASPSRP